MRTVLCSILVFYWHLKHGNIFSLLVAIVMRQEKPLKLLLFFALQYEFMCARLIWMQNRFHFLPSLRRWKKNADWKHLFYIRFPLYKTNSLLLPIQWRSGNKSFKVSSGIKKSDVTSFIIRATDICIFSYSTLDNFLADHPWSLESICKNGTRISR